MDMCEIWQQYANEMTGDSAWIALRWLEEDGRKLVAAQQAITNLEIVKDRDNGITDEMIARAKETPIDSVVEFTRGKTRAWCHDDNNPSMYHGTRTNTAVCPVCDKKFDPIAVLMTRDGMNFPDAVRSLI